ncbi:VOC family protein [Arthrobacter sp. zg-Y750]|uniref:VOC family protein n=1 Tax=Arthrobacter sp. zg-Y750 TaxID=2894189 RepID=UPI001E4D450C|nr:VOC family protein [Arthrobacter sp. zg-Y750]MCC9178917.1 VOC family protein [Arthrobacter sp. zg-Y750]
MPEVSAPFPAGAPCWADLASSDPQRAREFYAGLLGWEAAVSEPDGYADFLHRGSAVAGLMPNSPETAYPDTWTVYLAFGDAAGSADAAAEAGGQVMLDPQQVGSKGSMALLGDPSGGTIGIWQPADHPGFARIDEVGAPVWYELLTSDYPAALRFYRDVFGWETEVLSDTADFRYTTVQSNGRPVAGVMDGAADLPDGIPSHWELYFGHTDVDAAADLAEELGGAVLTPPEDSPYGRMVQLADPTGAAFWLMEAEAD